MSPPSCDSSIIPCKPAPRFSFLLFLLFFFLIVFFFFYFIPPRIFIIFPPSTLFYPSIHVSIPLSLSLSLSPFLWEGIHRASKKVFDISFDFCVCARACVCVRVASSSYFLNRIGWHERACSFRPYNNRAAIFYYWTLRINPHRDWVRGSRFRTSKILMSAEIRPIIETNHRPASPTGDRLPFKQQ